MHLVGLAVGGVAFEALADDVRLAGRGPTVTFAVASRPGDREGLRRTPSFHCEPDVFHMYKSEIGAQRHLQVYAEREILDRHSRAATD